MNSERTSTIFQSETKETIKVKYEIKTTQDMEEEFNKDMEYFRKKNPWK
jgi:hypothetical protein